MTSPRAITYRAEDGVAWITLNRPAVLNALDTGGRRLADSAEVAAADPDVVLVIVRGEGRAFSSGMDRAALSRGTIDNEFYRHWIRGLNCLEDMPKISVAVLHGYSIGGGLSWRWPATFASPPATPSSGSAPPGTGSSPTAPY